MVVVSAVSGVTDQLLRIARFACTDDHEAVQQELDALRQKHVELRATTSLARLWITQNRVNDARRHLEDVYSGFTEGFETPDLQAARLLLAHL